MERWFHDLARIALAIVVGMVAAQCIADEGPILLGPDARPPRIEPRVQERQPEQPDNVWLRPQGAAARAANTSRSATYAPHSQSNQTAPQSRAGTNRYAGQPVPQQRMAYRQAPTQRPTMPGGADTPRVARPQDRDPRSVQPTPEQLQRYRMHVQEPARTAPRDPWRQGTTAHQRRASPWPASPQDARLTQPKRNYRALFEPPGARQTHAPGQPRKIVIGGGLPSSSDPHMPNSGAQRLGSADGRRPTINSGPTPREFLQ